MILYINDFYVDKIEAISNQMAILASENKGVILAATRFLGQKSLRIQDLRERKFILPPWLYTIAIPLFILLSNTVHLFTEEKSTYKKHLLNISKKPIIVSIYRRPDEELIADLKKYNNIKYIFVELPLHKSIFIDNGFPSESVKLAETPSLFHPSSSLNLFNPEKIKILFASWNNSEGNALYDRGLFFLKDLLLANDNLLLVICLRGRDDGAYREVLRQNNLIDRVMFERPANTDSLKQLYEEADFVAFIPQKRISKDVPNSIIDGFMFGKPAMVSAHLDMANTIETYNLGIVFQGTKPGTIHLTKQAYTDMQRSVIKSRNRYKKSNYIKIIGACYEAM